MKTDSIYKTSLLAAALLLAATSCVKDELHDTPYPDTGKITVTADWTDGATVWTSLRSGR